MRPAAGFQPNYFVVLVDGVVQPPAAPAVSNATFDTGASANWTATLYPVAKGLDPTKAYDIRIFKSTEAQVKKEKKEKKKEKK